MGVVLVGPEGGLLAPFVAACARLGLPNVPVRMPPTSLDASTAIVEIESAPQARETLGALLLQSPQLAILAVVADASLLDVLLDLGVDDCAVAPLDEDAALVRLRLCLARGRARVRATRDRDDRLQLALAAAHMATFDWVELDHASAEAEGGAWLLGDRVGALAFSPSLPEVTGLPPALFARVPGALPVALVELVHEPDRPRVLAALAQLFGQLGSVEIEFRVVRPGAERWLQINARAFQEAGTTSLRGTVMDVTARKAVELSLRQALAEVRDRDERFRLVGRATNDAVWDWDLRTDVVTWYENFARLFGYSFPDDRTPLSWWSETLHPDDRERVVDGIHDAIEFGEETWEDEYRFRCADGSYAQVLDRGLVLRDSDGRPLRMIGAMMDITERREMQARLLVADRLASVGTLAAGVAHEINNPLAYVLANLTRALHLLERKGSPQAAELSGLVREAQDGAARVRRIVQDLRVFARADDDVREQVDLRDVVRSSVHLADNEIRHRARLELALSPIPLVDGNQGRLGQVVVNLLVNAAQAIPEGAADRNVIRVSTRVDAAGRPVLEVSDTGPGIPVEIQGRIFDPFYTTKRQSEGTGLGLTICAGIVASLGGKIELESEPGRGSTFRIVLPRATSSMKLRAAPVTPPAANASSGPRPGARKRLLVVDDEPLIGKSLGFMLDDWYEVEWTTSGRDALARVDALAKVPGGPRYDAILCDLMMPEMSGMEGARRARAPRPGPRRPGGVPDRGRVHRPRARVPGADPQPHRREAVRGRGAAGGDRRRAPARGRARASAGHPAGERHQSMIAAPQVNPEPNATSATFIPRFSLPLRSDSARRIGIVAAVVLP